VAANQAGLPPGAYSGRVQIIDANGIRYSVIVSLDVSNAAQKLTASPSILRFTARAPAAATLIQDVLLNNSGGGGPIPLTATITAESSWISSATLNGNQTSSTLHVQVNTQGLSTGSYRDIIHVSSANTSIDVPVVLFVAASGPILRLNALGVSFQPGSSTQTLEVLNSGDPTSTVHWTASLVSGSGWLNIESPTGAATASSPGVLSLALNGGATGLAPGVYYSLIKISDPNALDSPQYVTAMLNLPSDTGSPNIDLDPAGLVFTANTGGTAPPSQQIEINGGPAATQRSSTFTNDGGAWLAASLSSGSLSVSVNPQGLGPGLYAGQVNISAGDVLRSANISLIVEPAPCTPAKLALNELNLGDVFAVTSGVPVWLSVQLNDDCGALVKQGSVTASFSNGDSPLQLIGDSLGNYSSTWQPGAVTSQMVITLNASSGSLQPATAKLYGGIAQNQTPPPTLTAGGTLNVFNPVLSGPLSPGAIAEVFGTGLASSAAQTHIVPLPTTFNNTYAQIGPYHAPLYFLSSGQVNLQIPSEIASTQQVPVVLSVDKALTLPVILDIVPNAPGVLSHFDGPTPPSLQNNARIIAQHRDGRAVNSSNPGKPGETLVMYLVGLGATDPNLPSGMAAPASPLSKVVNQPTVTVDSLPSNVRFAGLTPGFVGLYQIDFQVPNGVHSGDVVVNVSQDSIAANPTLLAVSQ